MRKLIVLEFISLDGVMQAPGGPEEDTSNGFEYGGWSAVYADDDSMPLMLKQMAPADILLGRKTFDIFEDYWPKHADYWPGINEVTKYVLSGTRTSSDWQNTVFLNSVEDIKKLKNFDGEPIKVWGSGELVKLLLEHDLVDELWLKIYPVLLGKGKSIYSDATIPRSLKLTESAVLPNGVIFANYTKAGEVKTGTMGPDA
ncbi:dihydrofolate reductase family protein [Mucilaginibacter pedocola]|uniref:Dihydrofolate reductase n=1 Tax=Mucilaginibacter pedocola TaxID=1792845 RepID=A0A1S9PEP4_9SPHI|nr:dihydrofolate reductase family protein [Mucilaginibacter pedocola]OOQ59421.1 dihydrofolate reductase [Mucilaginibacter pedocola]